MPAAVSLSLFIALLVAGCGGEETLDLNAGDAGAGSQGAGGEGELVAGSAAPPVAGTDVPPTPTGGLDRIAYRNIVLPIFDRACASCHPAPLLADDHFQTFGGAAFPVATLTEAQLEESLAEVEGFLDLADPPSSELLRYAASTAAGDPAHPAGASPVLAAGGPDYQTVLSWITAAEGSADPTAPPPAGGEPNAGEVPCSALPRPELLRGATWFNRFRAEVNPMLTASCTGATCHGAAGAGGGLWLRAPVAECDVTWNFLAVQWFIDPVAPLASLLLTQPLDPTHANREVFGGMTDPRYQLLAGWIQAGAGAR